jgi:hypothetical protein
MGSLQGMKACGSGRRLSTRFLSGTLIDFGEVEGLRSRLEREKMLLTSHGAALLEQAVGAQTPLGIL